LDAEVSGIVDEHEKVEILETRGDFVRVRLPRMSGAPEGWLPKSAIGDFDPPDAPVKRDEFIEECAHQEQVFGVSGHYIAAVALLRSDITNNTTAQGEFGEIGLFRLTAAEWVADWDSETKFGFKFKPADINDWRNQSTLFALMARRALDDCEAAAHTRPNSIELLLAQLIGGKATASLKATPTTSVAAALTGVSEKDLPKGGLTRDQLMNRYSSFLKDGANALTGAQAFARIQSALLAALTTTAAIIPANLIRPINDAKAPAPSTSSGTALNLDAKDIPPARKAIAQQIVQAFADKGFNVVQQAAALANAIAESGLNPQARNVSSIEASFGLFQLNTKGGLGTGHDPADLVRAEVNIGIILNEALKVQSFRTATTLADAVSAFVIKIERPADQIGAIKSRTAIGQRLLV
jgi:hypothetical protein